MSRGFAHPQEAANFLQRQLFDMVGWVEQVNDKLDAMSV